MGIQGLLKGLQPFVEKSQIKEFSNRSLAVDASSWLHKSVYSISEHYVEATEKSKTVLDNKIVRVSTGYMERRCNELFHRDNIGKIYMVFDGKRCPLKAETNKERERRRSTNLQEARKYKKQGFQQKAEEKYKMCIKIHSNFANSVAEALMKLFVKNNRFECVFSPYEADAQLVKLCVDGHADTIITEDSDVLVYSAVCHVSIPIIFKLDSRSGKCDVMNMDWLISNRHVKKGNPKSKNDSTLKSILLSFANRQEKRPGHGVRLFVQACMLAGSDYSPNNLSGVGPVTAFKLMRENAHHSCNDRFRQVLRSISGKKRGNVDFKEYEVTLMQSEAVFYLHPVISISQKKVTTLTSPNFSNAMDGKSSDFSPSLERFSGDLSFLGEVNINDCVKRTTKEPTNDSPLTRATNFPIEEVLIQTNQKSKCKLADKRVSVIINNASQQQKKLRINPYKTEEKVLQDISNAIRENTFLKFVHKSGNSRLDEGIHRSTFLDKHSDYRFTKRKFDKNGRPISNPKLRMSIQDILKKSQTTKTSLFEKHAHARDETGCSPIQSENLYNEEESKHLVNESNLLIQRRTRSDFEDDSSQVSSVQSDFISSNKMPEETEYLSEESPSNFVFQSTSANFVNTSRTDPTFEIDNDEDIDALGLKRKNNFYLNHEEDNSISQFTTFRGKRFSQHTGCNKLSDAKEHEEVISFTRSKYFSPKYGKVRKVTLESQPESSSKFTKFSGSSAADSPQSATSEFQRVGAYASIKHNEEYKISKHLSPGNDSVISELSELRAPTSIFSPPTMENSFKSPELRYQMNYGDSRTGPTNSTPFQNNFNSIRKGKPRPSSDGRKQTTLFDAWSLGDMSSKRKSSKSFCRQLILSPKSSKITDHFYRSVVDEDIIVDDGDFIGL